MFKKTVVISINASWNIINFRLGIVRALQAEGYRVVALTPPDENSQRLSAFGIEHEPIEMDPQGASPVRDLLLLVRYARVLRRLRPAVYLGYTAKPNIYGSIAAHALGIPTINNVSGLGTAFIREGLLTRIVSSLYKLAFRRSATVFFQNRDDMALFIASRMIEPARARLLPGSGIDLDKFVPIEVPAQDDAIFRFLLIARLLWDKGIGEYVEAARIVRSQVPSARFQLLGFLDVENRTAVSRPDVEGWVAEGLIEYLGQSDDVRPAIAAADCIVLPSYREGLPRVLLEGAAMAKPLIATDVPGCRDVVDDGSNGFLCEVRSAASLAAAMLKMVALDPGARAQMGTAARAKAESQFSERIPVERYLAAIDEALDPSPR